MKTFETPWTGHDVINGPCGPEANWFEFMALGIGLYHNMPWIIGELCLKILKKVKYIRIL